MDLTIGQGSEKRTMRLDLPHFIFVGTSVNPSQIDSRLRRWFIVYNLLPYSLDQISKLIQVIGEQQQIAVRDSAARLLAEQCEGSPGKARVLFKKACRYSCKLSPMTENVAKDALYFFRYRDL
jgi:holliday junction DNA helicase RuvB